MGPYAATVKSSGDGENVNLPTLFPDSKSGKVPPVELAADMGGLGDEGY